MENLPEVVPREEWLAARKELMAKEKEEPTGRAVPLGLHVGGPKLRFPDEYDR